MKNLFKKNKNKFAPMPQPRQKDEITAEFAELAKQAFDAQYKAYVYQKETDRLNARLAEVNQESAARTALDKELEPKEEATNV